MAWWHKKYDPIMVDYAKDLAEVTEPIERKYRDQLEERKEEKEKLANEYILGRIDKYFNN